MKCQLPPLAIAALLLPHVATMPGGTADTLAAAAIRPATDAPKRMSPEESAKTFRLPPGFRAELVACEPLINEPTGVCWDEQGRLFVCELHGYNVEGYYDIQELNKTGKLDMEVRRIQASKEATERAEKETYGTVKLLLDTDGDGRMDKSIVWADHLPTCYGIVAARGGIIVGCAPDIVFLKDTDGDNRADVRETLFTGFAVGELWRGINCPQWGVDNWIYFGSGWGGGNITGPHLKTPVKLGRTDFRIKPDGSALEPVEGQTGTFGHAMTVAGERFYTSTSRHALTALPLPWRYLGRNPDAAMPQVTLDVADDARVYPIAPVHPWRLKRSQEPAWVKFYGVNEATANGFFTSCSGVLVYQDVAWPAEYRGQYFCCDSAQSIVTRSRLESSGPSFKVTRVPGEEKSEFLAAADSWFRPIQLTHGPDGAVWIVDMYREVIEDYSAIPRFLQQQYNVLNGQDCGRLWRLTHATAPKAPSAAMAKLNAMQLAAELASPHYWRRQTARRLLLERNAKSAVPQVTKLLGTASVTETALGALYTLEGLDALGETDFRAALAHPSPDVRRHALRLADRRFSDAGRFVEQTLLEKGPEVYGTDARLLLQVALSLGESKDARVPETLASLARQHGTMRWMEVAIASSAGRRESAMVSALVRHPGQGKGVLEALVGAIAARGNTPEIQRAKAAVANMTDAKLRAPLDDLLDQGLTDLQPLKSAASPAVPPIAPPTAEQLAELGKLAPRFLAALGKPRDKLRGRELFKDNCSTCHRAKGLGTAVGPDLDAEFQRAEETILKDILFPNETIRPSYETYFLRTARGETWPGILADESPTSLTLKLPGGDEKTVLRKKLASFTAQKVSLMPAVFGFTLEPQDVADIISFLRAQ